MSEEFPPNWAIARALQILEMENTWSIQEIKEGGGAYTVILKIARYVDANEDPQDNPDVVLAREACAQHHEEFLEEPDEAQHYRNGEYDVNCDMQQCALRAIKLYKESLK